MSTLQGARVAFFEARRAREMASLIRRHAGEPLPVPALREVPLVPTTEMIAKIATLVERPPAMFVFMTGAGTTLLLAEAMRLGLGPGLIGVLGRGITIARGPKPAAALKAIGVKPTVLVPRPHRTVDILTTLQELELRGARVAVVHAGEHDVALSGALRERGAEPIDLRFYEWTLTDADRKRLEAFIHVLVSGGVDVVAFTTRVHVRHLLEAAHGLGVSDAVLTLLRRQVIVAAVGPTCAEELRAHGVEPQVVPEHPKMGHLVVALGRYLTLCRQPPPAPTRAGC